MGRGRLWTVGVLAAVGLLTAVLSIDPPGATADDGAAATERQRLREETGSVDGVGIVDEFVNQTPEEALKHDLTAVAEGKGWTLEQAEDQYEAAKVVGEIAERIAAERPDIFVGSALSDQPGAPPTLYVKGPVDDFVLDLVRFSGAEIIIADNQPYNFDELEARKLKVHHALADLGFRYIATSINITGAGAIPAGVTVQAGAPERVADIVARLPVDLRADVRLTIHQEPNVGDRQAFGGMWVRDDGVNECTSGWSVRSITTDTPGVTTAGHCTGINQIDHPGHNIHGLTHKFQHRGQWGDVEWKTSDEAEPDDFYATAVAIRDTAAIEARANISVNESVCQYGRSSNDRDCTLDVQDVSQSCTNAGVFNDRLVLMDGTTAIGGDSGGGWSFANTAYGSDKGFCNPGFPNLDAWSVADLYDEAIGVRVACGC